jgi:hypothetical protein
MPKPEFLHLSLLGLHVNVRHDRLTAVLFRCQPKPALFMVGTLLTAIPQLEKLNLGPIKVRDESGEKIER